GHRADGDQPPSFAMLGDDRAPVRAHLGDRKAEPGDPGHLREEAVVAAGRLRAALDDVAGHDCSGQAVPVVTRPSKVPGSWANDERSVADTRTDDDVRSGVERLDNAPCAEIRVRGHGINAGLGKRAAGVEVAELMAGRLEFAEP